MKIKDKPNNVDKVQLDKPLEKLCFGFFYITQNNKYSFSSVPVGEKNNAYQALVEKLIELSGMSINEAQLRGKKLGAERIPYAQLSDSFQSICDNSNIVSKDSKVVVFRFCKQQYRIICKDDINHPNLMHIIGFDFHFNAYDHG